MRYTAEIIFVFFVIITWKHKNNKKMKPPKLNWNARDGSGEKLQKNHTITTFFKTCGLSVLVLIT